MQKENKLVTVLSTFETVLGIIFRKFRTFFYEMWQLLERQQLLSNLLRDHENSGGIKRGWHLSKPLNCHLYYKVKKGIILSSTG